MNWNLIHILVQSAATVPSAVDDDFSPGVLLAVLFVLGVILVLIGIGIVVAIVAVMLMTILIGVGIVSSSAIVAVMSKRWSTGVRTLVYQALTVAGAPCGVCLLWFGDWLFQFQLTQRQIVLFGLAAGVSAGLLIAFVLDHVARRIVLGWAHRFARGIP